MHKTLSRHASLVDAVRECSSSPCWMHQVDPGYFGYWSKEEVAVFLTTLVERERIGARAFADIGHAADLRIADLILESELDQGSICDLLQREIAKREATVAAPRKRPTNEPRARLDLEQAVASALSHQTELIHTIEEAALNIFDSELNSHLRKMLNFIGSKSSNSRPSSPRGLCCCASFCLPAVG